MAGVTGFHFLGDPLWPLVGIGWGKRCRRLRCGTTKGSYANARVSWDSKESWSLEKALTCRPIRRACWRTVRLVRSTPYVLSVWLTGEACKAASMCSVVP
jgi:hypothetical protein